MRVVVLSRVLFKPDGLEIILIHCLEYWFLSILNFLYCQDIIFPCVIDAILRINKNINLRIFKVIPKANFFELT